MSSSKPTILLVTGAFTTGACYDPLLPYLNKAGYSTIVASLPSTDPTNPSEHSAVSDGAYIMNEYLIPLLNEGKDVMVFAHSFGATCLGGADQPVAKSTREAQGLRGGVLGLVYISFAFVPEGKSQLEVLGGEWPGFCKVDTPAPGLLTFSPVIETLYNDTDPAMHAELEASHLPSATRIFMTPVKAPLWLDPGLEGMRVCIKTLRDQTFPPFLQDMFIENSPVGWDVREVDGGHCSFIARTEEVAKVILEAAERWMVV